MHSDLHTYVCCLFQVNMTWQNNWAKYTGSSNEFIFCPIVRSQIYSNLLNLKSGFVFLSGK